MKKIFTLFAAVLISAASFGQATHSIYDVQIATTAPFASALDGSTVTLKGLCYGAQSNGDGFFITQGDTAWSGIYVYMGNSTGGSTPAVGDSVFVTGDVVEFNELTEIGDVSAVTVINSGNPLPTPISITTQVGATPLDIEKYEGCLVQATSATCTNPSLGFGEWEINDGSGALAVNDLMFVFTPVMSNVYDVTGAFNYSFGAYKIEPRDANDISGAGAVTPTVPIYDIQYATAEPFASAYDGQTVITYGYVTGVYADGYFIQDSSSAWNGLMVYDPSSSNLPAIGDSITVEGDIDEFNELTQLVFPTSMTVESSGHSVTPVMVSANNANNEEYEDCYVMVSTATVTQTGLPGNQFEVNDGSGVLLVDDLLYSVSATVGNVYDLAGVMYYSFSERKLEPTSSNDVSDITGFVANEFVNVEVFPTAVDEAMVVTGANDMLVEIFNVNGQIVASERISNDRFEFDLSDLSAGMYTVRMQAGNKAHSVRIVKK